MARILTIDDDDAVRSIVAHALTRDGHSVIQAADGVEGAARLHSHTFDLVITDLIMPNREGIETIIELHRDFPTLPIIAMSGAAESNSNLRMAQLLGARSTLQKPFSIQELQDAVTRVLPAPGDGSTAAA